MDSPSLAAASGAGVSRPLKPYAVAYRPSGRFAAIPARRGKRSGVGATFL
jgi:hypothetical protein